MTDSITESDSQLAAGARESKSRIVLTLALVGLSIAEWFLFRRYFGKYIAHSFLGNWDQVTEYSRIYNLHFGLEKFGLSYLFTNSQYLVDKQAMKGLFVPFLGLLMTAVFGPYRLAVLSVNFALFISGQIAVATTVYRRCGLAAALLSIGLYLLSLTHYTLVGGIGDMRLDYSAMIMMGWAFIANLSYLENGGRARWVKASITLFLNVMTRSILIIYWNVALGLLFVLSLLATRVRSFKEFAVSPRRIFNLLCSSSVVFGLFLAVFYKPFAKYYIFRVANGEAALRSAQYGCHGYLQTFLFNCTTFVHHFQYMLVCSGVIALGLFTFQIRSEQTVKVAAQKRVMAFVKSPFCTLWTVLCVGCLMAISCFMPSPNHIGVMTIPCALFLTFLVNALRDKTSKFQTQILTAASVLVLALGFALFAKEMVHSSAPPGADPEMASLVANVNEVLSHEMENRDVSFICYPILSDEFSASHLEIYWYENRHKALPENYGPVIINPFQKYEWKQVHDILNQATFVVLPVREPPATDQDHEIRGQLEIRKHLPEIKKELDKSFYPIAVIDNKIGYSVCVFKSRKP